MSERVACKSCGKWMFHLATKCPHCGAPASLGEAPTLSAVEARVLLQATTPPRSESFADIARDFVLPQGGALELITSVLAAPLTVFTVLLSGYVLVRTRPERRERRLEGARLFAVPACTLLALVTVWSWENAAYFYVLIGVGFVAWLARTVVRSKRREDFS